jgi:GTP-binding protein
MRISKAELLRMAVSREQYPKDNLFEIAFAGRSNVGKSSLINTLVNRSNLARTSSTPGKTQTINFYNMDDKFRFVDLPGYGYAKVSKAEREKWGPIIEEYLHFRENLIEVILLLDIRHEPGEHDRFMYNWIKTYGFNGIIVATKSDKIGKTQWEKYIKVIQNKLGVENRELIIPFSAEKRINVDKVWAAIEEVIRVNKEQQSQ